MVISRSAEDIGKSLLKLHLGKQEPADFRFREQQGRNAGETLHIFIIGRFPAHGGHLDGHLQLPVFTNQCSGGLIRHDGFLQLVIGLVFIAVADILGQAVSG